MRSYVAALCLATMLMQGCPKGQFDTLDAAEQSAQGLRAAMPSYSHIHQLASAAAKRNFLVKRETELAGIALGASTGQVVHRLGEPDRKNRTPDGEWWDYEAYLQPLESERDGIEKSSPKPRTNAVRVLFQPAVVKDPVATGAATTAPTNIVTQIQAWAPGSQETQSLIRLLDPVVRVERKYGKPARTLSLGWSGGDLWLYPAADVAFVVTAPLTGSENREPPLRLVAATIVGL